MRKLDYRLNAIVDGSLNDIGDLAELAAIAAANGATLIQYRDKDASTLILVQRAAAIGAALAGSGVPFVVNDRIDVALAAGAQGVHLGRDDMEPAMARRLLGPDAIIGMTVKDQADADKASDAPVDYACIGGVFETLSKQNPDAPLGIEGFVCLRRRIGVARPDLPVGAIAGINTGRAREVVRAGASGVAVISAIFRAADIAMATRDLRHTVNEALEGRSS